jgi:hypothetical protein
MNYNTTLFNDHNVYVTAGHEVQEDMSRFVSGSLQQLSDPFFLQQNLISGSGALQFAGGGYGMSGFHSLFGRFNYDFKNKYFIKLGRQLLGEFLQFQRCQFNAPTGSIACKVWASNHWA